MTSLSSPLFKTSSFSRRISRARFRFTSTDLVWWHICLYFCIIFVDV
uniref:Uncharacterized protein n=1 Tax=Anguilla anguilla TaxID=7936 RepID=A0A0E9U2V3_ANGAN